MKLTWEKTSDKLWDVKDALATATEFLAKRTAKIIGITTVASAALGSAYVEYDSRDSGYEKAVAAQEQADQVASLRAAARMLAGYPDAPKTLNISNMPSEVETCLPDPHVSPKHKDWIIPSVAEFRLASACIANKADNLAKKKPVTAAC